MLEINASQSLTDIIVWVDVPNNPPQSNFSNMSTILDYYYIVANRTANVSSILQSPVEDCKLFCFVFYTLVMGTLSILGILGNSLSMAVLQKDSHNRVAAFLLQSLALADSLVLVMSFLFLSIIYGLLPYIDQEAMMGATIPYVVKYVHPVGYMAQCGTIWITVLLAVNRYIAIVKPFRAVAWCTLNKARLQVLTVFISAVVLNFPRFFQYRIVHMPSPNGNDAAIIGLKETVIGEHTIFGVVYTNIIYTVLVLIIPLLILMILNSRLIREFKCTKKTSKTKRKSGLGCGIRRQASFIRPPLPEEDNITFIMVIIIVILIVCHTPDRIFQIYRHFFTTHDQLKCGQTLYYLSSVCNLLIVINSSCNFIIYYILRRRFRKTLMNKVCAWSKFRRYKEQPSFLEHQTPVSLLRRNTDGGMLTDEESEADPTFNAHFRRMKTGSAPCII